MAFQEPAAPQLEVVNESLWPKDKPMFQDNNADLDDFSVSVRVDIQALAYAD